VPKKFFVPLDRKFGVMGVGVMGVGVMGVGVLMHTNPQSLKMKEIQKGVLGRGVLGSFCYDIIQNLRVDPNFDNL